LFPGKIKRKRRKIIVVAVYLVKKSVWWVYQCLKNVEVEALQIVFVSKMKMVLEPMQQQQQW
jgi:hypothetical protein